MYNGFLSFKYTFFMIQAKEEAIIMLTGNCEKLAGLKSEAKDSAAYKKLELLFDEGSFVEYNGLAKTSGKSTGVVTGYGYVDGALVYAFAQDGSVEGGALGRVHAEKIKKVYDNAAKTGAPVVAVFDSNGVRLNEGNSALAAYGEILAASAKLSGVVPQISVVSGICAGCSAMLACSADFVIMNKDAQLFLNAPFTSAANGDTTEGAGSADNAVKAGVAHIVCEDESDAAAAAKNLLLMLPSNNLSQVPVCEYQQNAVSAAAADDVKGVVASIADADSEIEISSGFGGAYTALATVLGSTVGFVAANGLLTADDCVKTARFVRTCDAFSIPVITLINSAGFNSTAKDELAGSVRSAAMLSHAYAEATTQKIALVTGKAIGAVNVALAGKGANADLVIAWADAVISALDSETAAEFFMHDRLSGADDLAEKRAELAKEYELTDGSAIKAAEDGYIDDVINPSESRQAIINALGMLEGKRVSNLPKKHGNMPL